MNRSKLNEVDIFSKTIEGIKSFKPNLKNEKGRTLLYMVVKKGKFNLLNSLLDKGANPFVTDKEKISPLLKAIQNNAMSMVETILAHDITSANLMKIDDPLHDNFTLLQWALIIKRFEIVEPLLRLGADPNFTDGRSYLPLFITSRHGHEATVLALLKWGADINGVEMTKMTAIHIAAYKN